MAWNTSAGIQRAVEEILRRKKKSSIQIHKLLRLSTTGFMRRQSWTFRAILHNHLVCVLIESFICAAVIFKELECEWKGSSSCEPWRCVLLNKTGLQPLTFCLCWHTICPFSEEALLSRGVWLNCFIIKSLWWKSRRLEFCPFGLSNGMDKSLPGCH